MDDKSNVAIGVGIVGVIAVAIILTGKRDKVAPAAGMLSSEIGMVTGRPSINLQKENGTWLLSLSSGVAEVEIHTASQIEIVRFENTDTIEETNYGFKAYMETIAPPTNERLYDAIRILGNFSAIKIINDREVDFYLNVKLILSGTSYTY